MKNFESCFKNRQRPKKHFSKEDRKIFHVQKDENKENLTQKS